MSLSWSGGLTDELDLKPAMLWAGVYDHLATGRDLFRTVRTGLYGSVLEWADGTILPARAIATVAELKMTNSQFRDAMRLLGMSYAAMGAHLGLSESQIGNFRRDKPVPNHVALAVRHLLHLRLETFSRPPLA